MASASLQELGFRIDACQPTMETRIEEVASAERDAGMPTP
jgi:hypothetical protein